MRPTINVSSDRSECTCVIFIIVVIVNLIFGTVSANYLIGIFFHATLPLFWTAVIGLFGGEVIIPLAVIVFILRMFGLIG